jgi:plastocyanin
MANRPISLDPGGPNPDPLMRCKAGDKIIWTNNTGQTITAFTLPTCVSPKTNPAPIAPGKSRTRTVNNAKKGTYPYSYVYPDKPQTTKNGTIDVGS